MAGYRIENPTTGEVEKTYEPTTDAQLQDAIAGAHEAYLSWREAPLASRAAVLTRAADTFEERADEMAQLIAREMGKPLAQGVAEVKLSASILRWYGEHAAELIAPDQLPALGAQHNYVEMEPVGVILGVMPWNFPYYQLVRLAAPNLLLGNTILLKPAGICPASGTIVEEILLAAGLPEGAYRTVLIDRDQIQDAIADDRVRGVSLTGSEAAGAAVAEGAGRHLKKSVLELGGSDAMIVLGGDVRNIARVAAKARLSNAGQACNSPKRMIVLQEHYDTFLEALVEAVESTRVGDPTDEDMEMGPLSSADAVDTLAELVDDAREKGVTVRTGGSRLERDGAFFAPTVLTDVTPEMRAYSEELFGPVAVVYPVADVDAAVELANSSSFGLSGSVWTDDLELAESTARRLEVGMAYVNEHGTTMAGLPFGGVKRSGFGRELGAYGIEEFANRRLVRVAPARSSKA
ncbi:NAD-dependent succinate-semialdehyde dehydrogenase [Mobilicoccus pelagius]|uniref:Putative aldehyde dehydrogenase n=1 Tax=Mobilicoccus pelagius NBRC 104925 TaxID=1089455 RepID=H5UU68_9MICO|nr:NAD-dependent succinate-semialdehyde dehydrogenase [Mobilicoccus pelagius]GAB49276.1 putative aldehyde dehydrogenase [Mobilicoccus pelagius NBRC 104925]